MGRMRVVLHGNAGAEFGMGHLMRLLALAETARDRGWDVSLVGDIGARGLEIARRAHPGLDVVDTRGPDLARELRERAALADVVHLDTYAPVPDLGAPAALISSMQDGPFGVRDADLAIDANLGAERSFVSPDRSRLHLAGGDVAVVRTQVLRQRDRVRAESDHPRILVVMGGTDPRGLTARVVAGLGRLPSRLDVTVIDPAQRPEVREAAAASPHDVRVSTFAEDLPAIARQHDLVVTAAGTSVWDFACMGLPMALVCAVENQRTGYLEVADRGLALGLGEPPHDDLEERVAAIGDLLGSRTALDEQRARLRDAIDGRGTWRIVESWEQLIAVRPTPLVHASDLAARSATIDDAPTLLEWRNDPGTRKASRTPGVVDVATHTAWLTRVLADQDRRLLIVESGGVPIATCRWDRRSLTDWEVSITLAPAQRGRGLASRVLATAQDALDAPRPHRMIAVVHVENLASLRVFQRAGYLPHRRADDDGFLTFASWRLRGEP